MKKLFVWGMLLLGWGLTAGLAGAVPVQWTGPGANYHWYEGIHMPGGITWTDARAAAEARGGYLATATSEAENLFIFSLINDEAFWYNDPWNSMGPWLGGYYVGAEGTMNPDDWAWVSGEPWEYRNWAQGEPNFADEKALHFFGVGLFNRQPTWNNLQSENPGPEGYVVEWNNKPVRAGVPSLLLLLMD